MKKLAAITVLTAVLFSLCAGYASAEYKSLYVAEQDVTVYVRSPGGIYRAAFFIPHTYYFAAENGAAGYIRIRYNDPEYGAEFYVPEDSIRSGAAALTDDEVPPSEYFFSLDDVTALSDRMTYSLLEDPSRTYEASGFEIIKIYGIYPDSDRTLFYAAYKLPGAATPMHGLIPADRTDSPGINAGSVTPHPNSLKKPSGDGNSAPPADIAPLPSPSGENALVRGAMIAVICVLCAIVVFLIFRPVKNKKERYEIDEDYHRTR